MQMISAPRVYALRVALLAVLASAAISTAPHVASAQALDTTATTESRRAVVEGSAALSAKPPKRDEARRAFEHAILAGDLPAAVAEAHLRLATLDEEDREFARALEHYRACTAAAPGSRSARSARMRITWLEARSEGDFVPLTHFQRILHTPAPDTEAMDAFAREVETFPPGLVRAEARMFVGEAWLKHSNRRAEAIAALRKVVEDSRLDPMNAMAVQRDIVEALIADGKLDEAAAELKRHSFEPQLAADVRRLLRRRLLRRFATAALATFAVIAGLGIAHAVRRRGRGALRELVPTPRSLVRIVVVAASLAGGVALASYEGANLATYLLSGIVMLGLLVFVERSWGRASSRRAAANIVWTLACCATAIAAAFLVMDTMNPAYVERLGLFGR